MWADPATFHRPPRPHALQITMIGSEGRRVVGSTRRVLPGVRPRGGDGRPVVREVVPVCGLWRTPGLVAAVVCKPDNEQCTHAASIQHLLELPLGGGGAGV